MFLSVVNISYEVDGLEVRPLQLWEESERKSDWQMLTKKQQRIWVLNKLKKWSEDNGHGSLPTYETNSTAFAKKGRR